MATLNYNTEVVIIQRVAVDGHLKYGKEVGIIQRVAVNGYPFEREMHLGWVAFRSCSCLVAVARCTYVPTSLGTCILIRFLHVARPCFFRMLLLPHLERGCLKTIQRVRPQEIRVSWTPKKLVDLTLWDLYYYISCETGTSKLVKFRCRNLNFCLASPHVIHPTMEFENEFDIPPIQGGLTLRL